MNHLKKLLAILLLLAPFSAFATPVPGTLTYLAGSGTTQTISGHNHPAGQLIVAFASGAAGHLTSVTRAGQNFVQVSSVHGDVCGAGSAFIYVLDNAAAGTDDIVFTYSTATGGGGGQGVVSIANADISATVGTTTACGSVTSSSISVTTTVNDSIVVDALQISSGECCTLTVGADQTALRNASSDGPDGISHEAKATAGATPMSWTWDGSSRSRAHAGAEILAGTDPAAAAPATPETGGDTFFWIIKEKTKNFFASMFPYFL